MIPIDYTGLAAVIVAIGAIIDRIFSQLNTRKAIDAARAEALVTAAEATVERAKQGATLSAVADNVDGNLSATKAIADQFATEVERVAAGGTPTKSGLPDADNPVTVSVGRATTIRPEKVVPIKTETDK